MGMNLGRCPKCWDPYDQCTCGQARPTTRVVVEVVHVERRAVRGEPPEPQTGEVPTASASASPSLGDWDDCADCRNYLPGELVGLGFKGRCTLPKRPSGAPETWPAVMDRDRCDLQRSYVEDDDDAG